MNPNEHKCEICNQSFWTKEALSIHTLTHGERLHTCLRCAERFYCKIDLTEHEKIHSNEEKVSDSPSWTCTTCAKNFSSNPDLQQHISRMHAKKNTYICPVCGRGFAYLSELAKHNKTAHKVFLKPFKCPKCGDVFVTKMLLVQHQQTTHAGESMFQCASCDYAAPNKAVLAIHFRTHTGEKPFACTMCAMTFTTASNLNSHVKGVHNTVKHKSEKRYRCNGCQRIFKLERYARTHMKTHHISPLSCDICHEVFEKQEAVEEHILIHLTQLDADELLELERSLS